jgi:hypothetical protein
MRIVAGASCAIVLVILTACANHEGRTPPAGAAWPVEPTTYLGATYPAYEEVEAIGGVAPDNALATVPQYAGDFSDVIGIVWWMRIDDDTAVERIVVSELEPILAALQLPDGDPSVAGVTLTYLPKREALFLVTKGDTIWRVHQPAGDAGSGPTLKELDSALLEAEWRTTATGRVTEPERSTTK